MATGKGANFKLLAKEQPSDEVTATGNYSQFPCLSFGLSSSQELGSDDLLSAGVGRDGGDPYLDAVTVDGQGVVPIDLTRIGFWLKMMLGAPTSTGTTDRTHLFKSGLVAIPSFSVEKAFPDIPRYELFTGVKLNTMAISLDPSGPANATLGFLGLGQTAAATSGAGTPDIVAITRFFKPSGAIKKNGVSFAKITAGNLNFGNGAAGVRVVRPDARLDEIELGSSSASGDLTMRFGDTTAAVIDDAIAGTPVSLDYSFTITATKSITFTLPRVFLSRPRTEVSGPGGVSLPVSWRAAYDATAGYMMAVSLRNQTATY